MQAAPSPGAIRALKVVLFLLCLLPLGRLALETLGVAGLSLGANPVEELLHRLGKWGLNFLLITLAVTPLRRLSGWNWLIRFRRMLGLFAFFYGVLHFLGFAWLDMGFDLGAIVRDVAKRPFILVGTLALLTMLPLAATSFNRAIKALGAARWQALHRAVYATALLGLLHFFWMRSGKNDFAEVAVYAAIIAALLGWRLWRRRSRAAGIAVAPR